MSAYQSYRANKIVDRAERNARKAFVAHSGVFVTMHSIAPPPVAEYDRWLAEVLSADPRGNTKLTGAKLRRAVLMIRAGSLQKDAARAIGVSQAVICRWLARLPQGLAA